MLRVGQLAPGQQVQLVRAEHPAVAPLGERDRRLLRTELVVVFAVTLGLSGVRSLISLLDALAGPVALDQRTTAIDQALARNPWADLAAQLAGSFALVAWGALGLYLLVRAGSGPRDIGLDGRHPGRDALGALGLTALIGIPGLGLYLAARALDRERQSGERIEVVARGVGQSNHDFEAPVALEYEAGRSAS